MGRTLEKLGMLILIGGIALIMLEGIFVDYTVDSEYAIAQSYRMVRGDGLFLQMWEPHQTSAFLCAGLIWLWEKLTGSLTGVVLFLHGAGLILKAAVFVFLIRTLKGYLHSGSLAALGIVFLAISPKGLLLPEFSNMQMYFSVCLFCCLFRYLQDQKKIRWLCLAAISLCLEVLSYPTCLLIYFIAALFLWKYGERKGRDLLLFTGVCAAIGGSYILYYVNKLGLNVFLECVGRIVAGDDTHTGYLGSKWHTVGQEILMAAFFYGGLAVITVSAIWAYRKMRKGAEHDRAEFAFLYAALLCVISVLKCFIRTSIYQPREGALILLDLEDLYLPLICLGILAQKNFEKEQKLFVKLGISISMGGMFATLLLTNLGLNHALKYMTLGVCVSAASIGQWMKGKSVRRFGKWIAFAVLFAIVFRNAFLIQPKRMIEYNRNILELLEMRNKVSAGPAIGIYSDYMGPYIMNQNLLDWEQLVMPGDNVIIVGGDHTSTIAYLYEDVNICVDSTICTPTYNEKLLRYWELNPDKIPNVVIVESMEGHLAVSEDSWIMRWINEEFGEDAYVDGSFIRCYRR